MRILLLLLFTLVHSLFLLSQDQRIDSENIRDNAVETLTSLEEKGLKAYQEADYQASIYWKEKLVKEAKSQLKKGDVRLYVYIKNLAFLYKKTSELNKAEQLYEEARQILSETIDTQDPRYASLLLEIADLHEKKTDYPEAEALVEEAKNIQANTLGKTHIAYANTTSNLAMLYALQGYYAKSETLFLEAKEVFEKQSDIASSNEYARFLNNYAELYKSMGRYDQAEALFERSTAIYRKTLGEEHYGYAASLNNLGRAYSIHGRYEKALPLFEEAKIIFEKTLGKEHPSYAMALKNIGSIYYNLGDYEKVEPIYKEVKSIRAKALGKSHPDYAESLIGIADLYQIQGLYNQSEPLLLQSRNILQKALGSDHSRYIRSISRLADLYRNEGIYEKAEPLYEEIIALLKKTKGTDHPDYAAALNQLGLSYTGQGLYALAEPIFIESKTVRSNTLGIKHPEYASTLNNLGFLYSCQGLFDKAEPLYVESNQILKETLGTTHLDYAASLDNLASLYSSLKDYGKAESLFLEAIDIREKSLGKDHKSYASSLNNLAIMYGKQEHFETAGLLLEQSRHIIGESLGEDHPRYASTLQNLALFYEKQGHVLKAESLLFDAMGIRAKKLGKDHPDYTVSLNSLGRFFADQGKYARAEPYLLKTNQSLLTEIEHNFSNLSENEKEEYYAKVSNTFEKFQSFVQQRHKNNPEIIAENFNLILATKGLLFQSNQRVKRSILASGDLMLIETFEKWQKQRAYLGKLYEKTIADREKLGVSLPKEEAILNSLEKQLSSKSQIFAEATDKTHFTWENVRDKLAEDEIAVEIVRFDYFEKSWTDSTLYAVMVVTPTTKKHPKWVVLPNGNELEGSLYKNYRSRIRYRLEDTTSIDFFWKSLNIDLTGVKKVYLSADGIYHSISLEGLYDPIEDKYLADEVDIIRIRSTKSLLVEHPVKHPQDKVQILGYPNYNVNSSNPIAIAPDRMLMMAAEEDSSNRFFSGQDIPLLPGTKVEVQTIQEIFDGTNLEVNAYLENEATEQAVKSWSNPMIAHIATHGYFLKDKDLHLEASRIGGVDKNSLHENPLLRSGILLTNAKQAFMKGGNGILTAFEARDLDFSETELVVLSACETGLGEVKNGEGVYGLQRSFMEAGASLVIMSLWTVNDRATQELMVSFYENWLIRQQSKREAFKNAKLELRQEFAHPYYWSAFVMSGI